VKKHRVFYFSSAPENVYEIIREEVPDGFELVTLNSDSDEERKAKIVDCEVVIVAAKPIAKEFIEAAHKLRLVHHQGVGYQDTVDVEALQKRGIALALTPAGTTIGVAEHTVLLTLAVCKRLPFADRELREGRWHIYSLRPYSLELYGRTIGYVGMGRIAREVAFRFKAFGTRGIYCDPYVRLPEEEEKELSLRRVDFDDLLRTADVLTLHVPATKDTYHLIDLEALHKMKRTAILINTSRGSIVDEGTLCEALKNGVIAGAGLDVFEVEPFQPSNPLAAMDNVVLTPHISAGTRDALKAKMKALFENLIRFFNGEEMENQVHL
jgi:phosphoglycerate dehydrogenase-like enzyme